MYLFYCTCFIIIILICLLSAIQAVSDVIKDPSPSNADPPKEPSGPVWTSYADNYFEGDFAAPFSDLEEEGEGEGETMSSSSSDGASQEDNPPTCDDVDGNHPKVDKLVSQSEGFSQSVDPESPLGTSSGDSHNHTCTSSEGSRNGRLVSTFVHKCQCFIQNLLSLCDHKHVNPNNQSIYRG